MKKGNKYYFPLVYGGLGDKFCIFSSILKHRSLYEDNSILYLVTNSDNESFIPLGKNAFKSIVDFFHFRSPNFNIKTQIITKDRESWQDMIDNNFKENRNFDKINNNLLTLGEYWPIDFVRNKQNKFCYMLYESKWFSSQNDKYFSSSDMKKFYTLCEYLPIKGERLEDYNFARNVEILAESEFIVASEGMWTHLSRAMKIPTIAYTIIPEWNDEINSQGHFCSPNIEEVFFEVMRQAEI
tara:strand:+ start:2174 stop:2893 length:720 start_codon:yes stop_codon:yes gene_type:complete